MSFILISCSGSYLRSVDDIKKNGISAKSLHFVLLSAYDTQCQKLKSCPSKLGRNIDTTYTISKQNNPVCNYWKENSEKIFNAPFGRHASVRHADKHYTYSEMEQFLDYHFSQIKGEYSYKIENAEVKGYKKKKMVIRFIGNDFFDVGEEYSCDQMKRIGVPQTKD